MTFKKLKSCAIGLAAAGLFSMSAAHADTLDSLGAVGGLAFDWNIDGSPLTATVGRFDVDNQTTSDSFIAYCLEVIQGLDVPDDYTASAFSNAGLQALYDQRFASVDTRVEEAAFQIALWEILDDSDLTTGQLTGWAPGDDAANPDFALEVEALALTEDWLANLADPSAGNDWNLTAWRSDTSQDLISATPSETVPVPSSLLLGLTGIFGLAALRRRA